VLVSAPSGYRQHVVIEYLVSNPLAYDPSHRVTLQIGGDVEVRLAAFFGTPGQTLAVHLEWGSNLRTHSARTGSPSTLLAIVTPDASGFSNVRLPSPSVFRSIPSGPTTLMLRFYDATLGGPPGGGAEVYPDGFTAMLEVTTASSP
jgi:hypothetical protein